VAIKTKEEIKQIIADNPTMCWYRLGDVDMCAWPGLPDEDRALIDKARPKCGYHCRDTKCPVSGERTKR